MQNSTDAAKKLQSAVRDACITCSKDLATAARRSYDAVYTNGEHSPHAIEARTALNAATYQLAALGLINRLLPIALELLAPPAKRDE